VKHLYLFYEIAGQTEHRKIQGPPALASGPSAFLFRIDSASSA
jgi:hypothetical protein